jgi:hypothetical protein
MKRKDEKPQVGRVDYRALMANRASTFGDRRTRRARTRAAADRREMRLQD